MIIDRYLIREIAKPLTAICTILVVIFTSYGATHALDDAVLGLLPANMVFKLIFLKILISLEILLPIALFLSVIIGLGRLHNDSEMVVLSASGISELQLLRAVLYLSLFIAGLVAGLSLYGRPWAYQQSYWLRAQAAAEFDLSKLQAGRFYESPEANQTVFAERIDRQRKRLERVFLTSKRDDTTQIIYADQAYQLPTTADGAPMLVLLQGHVYQLDRNGNRDRILKFGELKLPLDGYEIKPDQRRKAESTAQLARSADPQDIAEFQWRISRPLFALVLGLLGVPVSRAPPNRGRYSRVLLAVLVYFTYSNLSAMAKTWVEQERVGSIPGIWWVDVLPAILLLVLLLRLNWNFRLTPLGRAR